MAVQVKEDVYEKIDKELLTFVEDVLLNRCDNATERLLEYAAILDPKSKPCAVRKKSDGAAAGGGGGPAAAEWRSLPVTKRIEHALVKGLDTYIVQVCSPLLPLPLPRLRSAYCMSLVGAAL